MFVAVDKINDQVLAPFSSEVKARKWLDSTFREGEEWAEGSTVEDNGWLIVEAQFVDEDEENPAEYYFPGLLSNPPDQPENADVAADGYGTSVEPI